MGCNPLAPVNLIVYKMVLSTFKNLYTSPFSNCSRYCSRDSSFIFVSSTMKMIRRNNVSINIYQFISCQPFQRLYHFHLICCQFRLRAELSKSTTHHTILHSWFTLPKLVTHKYKCKLYNYFCKWGHVPGRGVQRDYKLQKCVYTLDADMYRGWEHKAD